MARAGARWSPSVTSVLRGLRVRAGGWLPVGVLTGRM
jgi:hypothetical protein